MRHDGLDFVKVMAGTWDGRDRAHLQSIMAVVEDYVPDSDDEDVAQSPPPPRPIPAESVKQQLPNGDSTKGSSIPDLVGRLRVPDEFKDTAKASELCESMAMSI